MNNLVNQFLDSLYIKFVLEKLNISSNKLAEITGIAQSRISTSINFKHSMSWSKINKIQEKTNIPFKCEEHLLFAHDFINNNKVSINLNIPLDVKTLNFFKTFDYVNKPTNIIYFNDGIAYIDLYSYENDYTNYSPKLSEEDIENNVMPPLEIKVDNEFEYIIEDIPLLSINEIDENIGKTAEFTFEIFNNYLNVIKEIENHKY